MRALFTGIELDRLVDSPETLFPIDMDWVAVDREEILQEAENRDHDILLCVVGPTIGDSVSLVQRLQHKDKDISVILVCHRRAYASTKQTIQLSPFIGNNVGCYPENSDLTVVVKDVVSRAYQKRRYKAVSASVQSSMKQPQSVLTDSNVLLGHIMDVAPIGVMLLNDAGQVSAANNRMCEMLHRNYTELIGKDLDGFFPGESGEMIRTMIDGRKKESHGGEGLVVPYHVSGTDVFFEITSTGLDKKGHILIFNDVTEKQKAQAYLIDFNRKLDMEVKKRTEELAAKNKELEHFTFISSHDLQEPMQIVNTYAQFLSEQLGNAKDPTVQKSLDFISQATQRMRVLIKGLQDYSRIGQNTRPVVVNIGDLLSEVLQNMSGNIKKHKAVVEYGKLPEIRGYKDELRLLFEHLIGNAIKYHSPGEVPEVKIYGRDGEDYWEFAVEDRGIGIPENKRERIFRIFQRLHGHNEYDGTGVGLAHCRKVVELHRGRIWVDAAVPHGSRFCFTLSKKTDRD